MIKLYTQPNCGLCEDAKLQLSFVQDEFPHIEVKEINILEDEALLNRYMLRVPVVTRSNNDKEVIIQEGNIDYVTVIEYLNELPL